MKRLGRLIWDLLVPGQLRERHITAPLHRQLKHAMRLERHSPTNCDCRRASKATADKCVIECSPMVCCGLQRRNKFSFGLRRDRSTIEVSGRNIEIPNGNPRNTDTLHQRKEFRQNPAINLSLQGRTGLKIDIENQ